ncbi:MAG: hypothetical protein AB9917_13670 [Negativicutes bacterium]
MLSIKVDAERLLAALEAAPENMRREMKLAMETGSRDVAARAKKEHRFVSHSSKLEQSIENELVSEDPLIAEVRAGNSAAHYARYIHDGTGLYGPRGERYPITPRFGRAETSGSGPSPRKLLRWVGNDGRWHTAKLVMHPGVKPDQFLIRAAEAEQAHLEELLSQAIDRAIK